MIRDLRINSRQSLQCSKLLEAEARLNAAFFRVRVAFGQEHKSLAIGHDATGRHNGPVDPNLFKEPL